MSSQAQRLISLFRTIVLAEVTALLISAGLPVTAQNAVPPTAVQAAKMPQFASRLAHPGSRPASPQNPALARQGSRNGPPQGNDVYDNGPINGNTDAWSINFGFVVSDTFTVGGGASVSGMSFGAWLEPGDTLQSVQLSITSSPNGGTSYFNQTVNFSQSGCVTNSFGFNVCLETSSTFSVPALNPGTYWVNLQNAVTAEGDPIYWDENSGVGCQSNGCPSQADENSVGTIPSESFTMLGETTGPTTCFESQGNLDVLYNFTQQNGIGAGVAIDRAGNLYGTTAGGEHGAGFAYKLARVAEWVLDPLFNFLGGYGGGPPTGAIVGPNEALYGGAEGGIQNCGSGGSQYCGLLFNLTPPPTACRTAPCGWNENVLYRFSSESDGSGVTGVSAYDREGNLYGTTSTGGTSDAGTVFELTPSGGGWTKTLLYSFTGGNDGGTPTQGVLLGSDGNLYGVATGGMYRDGVVFQLTPSGGGWTESVLHAFGSVGDSGPGYLVQDSAGNLYGIASISLPAHGVIFTLQKTGSGWNFSEYIVQHNEFDFLDNLTIDTAGNLYGTGWDGSMIDGGFRNRSPGFGSSRNSYIFKASYTGGTWNYEDLDYLENQLLDSNAGLALDTSGNLYGTTYDCGTNNSGTVWQLSP